MGFLVSDFLSLEVLSHHLIYSKVYPIIQVMVDFQGYTPEFTNGWIPKMMGLGKGGSALNMAMFGIYVGSSQGVSFYQLDM